MNNEIEDKIEKHLSKFFNKMNVENLNDVDFENFARLQSKLFPDMLLFMEEEEILDLYYKSYQRKRRIEIL
jgi:hypothetical protein